MSKSDQTNWDVIIAGGGPAGFFTAIRCAELNPNLRLLIIEKARQTLGKVLISGGGRCNVTHACFDPVQWAIDDETFKGILRERPNVSFAVLRSISRRLREMAI